MQTIAFYITSILLIRVVFILHKVNGYKERLHKFFEKYIKKIFAKYIKECIMIDK
ncbi:hypothetical protein EMIT079MI2_10373 [Bacillus sp. IT-79MI2]